MSLWKNTFIQVCIGTFGTKSCLLWYISKNVEPLSLFAFHYSLVSVCVIRAVVLDLLWLVMLLLACLPICTPPHPYVHTWTAWASQLTNLPHTSKPHYMFFPTAQTYLCRGQFWVVPYTKSDFTRPCGFALAYQCQVWLKSSYWPLSMKWNWSQPIAPFT